MNNFIEFSVTQESKNGGCLLDQPTKIKAKSITIEDMLIMIIKSYNQTPIIGITLTLSAKWHLEDPIIVHRFIEEKINKSTNWKKLNRYFIFPEFTSEGNLHYHGIIIGNYQSTIMSALTMWKRQFGYVKPEFKLKYLHCNSITKICNQTNQKGKSISCWTHYMVKDYNKTGLWCIYNINPLILKYI